MVGEYLAIPFIFIFINFSNGENENLDVELIKPRGKIRGHILESAKGRNYYAFQEIPYGKPPIGDNRFKPPEIVDDWDDILDCTKNTKICYQFDDSSRKNPIEQEESEDCLHLNVYTPVKPGLNTNLSVLFYIFGGAFSSNDASFSSLGPKYLIDGDIIIVTMNSRLGPLGYLSTGDSEIPGNMGLKDQYLALEWTLQNIHVFGGNPNDIVLCGASSGAISFGYHMLNSKIEGQVSGFIQQSASAIEYVRLTSESRDIVFQLGQALNITSKNISTVVHGLKKVSAEELKKANELVPYPAVSSTVSVKWLPVIEDQHSNETFLTSPIYESIMNGDFNQLPMLIGFNSEESLWFIPPDEPTLRKFAAVYDTDPSDLISPLINVENKSAIGKRIKELYTNSSFQENLAAFVRFCSDTWFVHSIVHQALLASKYVPVYLYQLSYAIFLNDKYPGVSHSTELRYFWDMPIFKTYKEPVDEAFRDMMLTLWWNFIKYKNPTPRKEPITRNIEWPTVQQDKINCLDLNKHLSILMNPRNYYEVKNILLEYMRPPYYIF